METELEMEVDGVVAKIMCFLIAVTFAPYNFGGISCDNSSLPCFSFLQFHCAGAVRSTSAINQNIWI